MKSPVLLSLVCVVLLCASTFAAAPPSSAPPSSTVPAFLQDISVTIKAGTAQGSGTVITRKVDDETVTFVWTAAHVVADLRTVRRVVTADGTTRIWIEFKDPQIVQERYQDGRRVGEQTLDCKVIKYSDADYGEDLAVLMVRLKNAYPNRISAKFPSDKNFIPAVGVDLSHCGSLLGQFGSNSYTTGVLSQVGRLLEGEGASKKVFDQVTAVAFPGSSGGGVYLKEDGTYVGMLTQGVQKLQGFNFIVPVRRMYQWAKEAKIEWALDANVAVPTMSEIDHIAVEDSGSLPDGSFGTAAACKLPVVPTVGTWLMQARSRAAK